MNRLEEIRERLRREAEAADTWRTPYTEGDTDYLLRRLEIVEGALREYQKEGNWSCVHQSLHRADVGHECARDWWHENDGPAIARKALVEAEKLR